MKNIPFQTPKRDIARLDTIENVSKYKSRTVLSANLFTLVHLFGCGRK